MMNVSQINKYILIVKFMLLNYLQSSENIYIIELKIPL